MLSASDKSDLFGVHTNTVDTKPICLLPPSSFFEEEGEEEEEDFHIHRGL